MRTIKDILLNVLKTGVFIAPFSIFLFAQKTLFPMVTLKFTVFWIIIEILIVAWLWLILFYPEYRPRKSLILVSLLILLNVLTITGMMGVNPARSFWSTPDRMTGIFALWHFCAYFLMLYSLRKEINWRKYFNVLFIISLLVSVFVIVQILTPEFFLNADSSRPGSFLGNPAFLAGYLIFTIFIGAWLAKQSAGWVRIGYVAAVSYEVIALFIGSTRGAVVGLALGACVFLFMLALPKFRPFSFKDSVLRNPFALVVIVFVLLAGLVLATHQSPVWQQIPGVDRLTSASLEDAAISNRLIAWDIAIKGFRLSPIFGFGWENFKYPFDTYYNPQLFRAGFAETYWDRPHNAFLEYMVASGILGFLAYAGVLIVAFYVIARKTSKEFRPYGIGLMVAYIVQNLFFFDSFGTYLMLFAFLAFLASQEDPEPQPASLPASRPRFQKAGRSASLVLAAILGIFAIYTNVKIIYANYREYWGVNYLVQKMPVEGIASFKQALEVDQPYANDIRTRYLQTLSQSVSQMKIPQPKETIQFALDEYKKVLATDAFNYFNYYALADAKLAFGTVGNKFYNGSESDIRRAIQLSPNRQLSYYVYSKIKFLQTDIQGSIDMMARAVALDPLSSDPHYYYGLILLNTNRQAKALEEFATAVRLGYVPKDGTQAKQLGDFFGDAGDYSKALKYYAFAADFNKADADAYLKLGLVYMFMGEGEHARPNFEAVLRLVPGFKSTEGYDRFRPYFESIGL